MLLDPLWDTALAGVLGLMVGSFLNVVIYRLPKMMELQWAREHAEYTHSAAEAHHTPPEAAAPAPSPFNLAVPRSRCQACGHPLAWYENIPVLSYLALRGRCKSCKTHISARYPAVELLTGALFFYCIQHWGLGPTGLAWCFFSAVMVALAFIDWDTTFLPDDLTLPLLWAGLLAAAFQWTGVALFDAVLGATGGYLSLWLVYWGFKLATGKEGMGYGDFKLFAALGAWFGWQALVPLILMASVVGAIVGIAMKINSSLREGGYVPFGPFLVGAGLIGMVWGPSQVMQLIWRWLGL